MPAVKSKKDTKVPAKKTAPKKTQKEAPVTKEAASSKRKRVSFNEEPSKKKAVGKKMPAKAPVKEEQLESDGSDSEEEEVADKIDAEEEDLTEEQEEALRKEILGDMASSDEDEDSSDEEADAIDKNENVVSLDGKKMEESKAETKKTFDNKKAKSVKTPKTEEKGVIYLGRIPHGFYEREMKGYFSQFGDITRLRLSRNKKTGRSKHYGFIEFASAEVAEIVAETMHNYLLFGHMLQCKVIPAEKVHEKLFVGSEKIYKPANHELFNRRSHNKKKTPEELKKKCNALKKSEQKLRKQIKDAGIDYDFPAFS